MTHEEQLVASLFPDLKSISKLGQGGQKVVFRALHPADGPVVVKLLRTGQDPARVEREIRAVQAVVSPRVPRVLDAGVADTAHGPFVWLREQLVQGVSLRELVAQGPLAAPEVLNLGLHILEALVEAERCRIVHRDVKPDNIMRDRGGGFWLLDFGIARHLDLESLTATASMHGLGTPGYAPPEQFRNHKREIDARADLFALGVTLYEAATGTNPFRDGARDVLEVLRRVEQRPLPPLCMQGGVNGLADLVATLAQRRREHRPRTAIEALDWMKEVQGAACQGVA